MTFKTHGTCSTELSFELVDGKVHDLKFKGGCNGNLQALGILVEGMDADEAVSKLKGIRCGFKDTSCADQFATALESLLPS